MCRGVGGWAGSRRVVLGFSLPFILIKRLLSRNLYVSILTLIDNLWIKGKTRIKNYNQGPFIALVYFLFLALLSSLSI